MIKKNQSLFFSAKKLIDDKEYRKPHPLMTVIPDPHPRLASACPCRCRQVNVPSCVERAFFYT